MASASYILDLFSYIFDLISYIDYKYKLVHKLCQVEVTVIINKLVN